jgi:uncharacterized protein
MTTPSSVDKRLVTVVTGASGGIGADLARVFARNGHDLALVARSLDRLEALAAEIEASGRPRPIVVALDLARPESTESLAAALAAHGASPDVLVNNAGFGLVGEARRLDAAAQIEMIDLNVRSLADLTLRFLPDLLAVRGKILNVASVASFLPGPGMAVYYATKAFVLSFSEALTAELRNEGVHVCVLCPGATATGFQARAGVDKALLRVMPGMNAMAVAEAGYRGLTAGRRRVVPGLLNKLFATFLPMTPRAALLPVVKRLQARRRVT